ncbi:MAG: hypothetical protein K0S04_3 [Herbinix sp.]|nr:hypothetical protein [Herbinix sp.]
MKLIKKQMIALILVIFISVPDIAVLDQYVTHEVGAVTFDEINHPDLFLKQVNGDLQCTLVAATMLVRRAAMLSGNAAWADITVDKVKSQAWVNGVGLKYTFTYEGITVNKASFGTDPVNEALMLLQQHPEGIVLYDQIRTPRSHAVLLTDYTGEMFYCADPSDAVPYGRIPISSGLVQVKDAEFYYYVSSPSMTALSPSAPEESINPSIDINTYSATLSQTSYYYDGTDKKPAVAMLGLSENVDYNVSYIGNRNPGSAAVIITGIGGYTGTIIKSFEISGVLTSDYLNDIITGITKQTIQKGKTAAIKVTLPDSLKLVQEYNSNVTGMYNEVKISYASSNKKIAVVNSKGKITGKKNGTTKISITAELGDGTKKVFTYKITVK